MGHRVPKKLWALAALIVLILLAALAVIVAESNHPVVFLGTMYTDTLTAEYAGADLVAASIHAYEADVFIGDGATDLLAAEINYTYEGDVPVLSVGQGNLWLTQPEPVDLILLGGQRLNMWDVKLGDAVPLALTIVVDAGYLNVQARDLPLTDLQITVDSAEVELDLRGEWSRDLYVAIQAEQGDVTLRLPEGVGVRVLPTVRPAQLDAGDLTAKDDGSWVNAAYGVADVTLTVVIESARGKIRLRGE